MIRRMAIFGALLSAGILCGCSAASPSGPASSGDPGVSSGTSSGISADGREFVTAESLGCWPDDGEDDYAPVRDALTAGKSIYFGAGVYTFSRTIELRDCTIAGCGLFGTTLRYTGGDKGSLVLASGRAVIENMMLSFERTLLTGTEKQGEYVALRCDGMTDGSAVRNVCVDGAGTAVYAPASKKNALSGTLFETMEIMHFTYRGFDLQSAGCSGNTLSNIYTAIGYLGQKETPCDVLYAIEGEQKDLTIRQLNAEHSAAPAAILFRGCSGLNAETIHIEGLMLQGSDSAYIRCADTDGRIGAVTFMYTGIDGADQSLIRFGDAAGEESRLAIGVLQCSGLNSPYAPLHGERSGGLLRDDAAKSFRMLRRDEGASGRYIVSADSYVYFTFYQDEAIYDRFPVSGDLTVTRIGVLPAGGPSGSRPATRCYAGYTTYYDTTLGKLLTWNGTAWD